MTQLGEISFSRSLHHKRLHKDRVYVRVSTWHCAVTTRSQHGHDTVTTRSRSLRGHHAVTTRSLRSHYTQPLRFHNQRDPSSFPSASSSKARVASLPRLPSRASKSFLQKIHGRGANIIKQVHENARTGFGNQAETLKQAQWQDSPRLSLDAL